MDAEIFRFINIQLTNPAFDAFFPWLTNVIQTHVFQFAILPLILAAIFYAFRFRGLGAVIAGALLTWACDVFISVAIKPITLRPRPFMTLPDTIVRAHKPASTSFPSGHAADSFFLATFFTMLYPRLWPLYYTIAFLIAFSRVYVGVHYPGDVVGGAVIGTCLGYLTALLIKRVTLRWDSK
jgi:undecaprenyl-diphosphatase